MAQCLDATQRLAAADPTRPLPAAWREHLAVCPRCLGEVEGLREVSTLLADLGRAERNASTDPAPTWAAITGALERPDRIARLPLAWAGIARLASDVARPAFAGSLVAMVVGLGLGTWLGLASDRQSPAYASDVFDASNLDDAADDGFESGLLAADTALHAGDGATTNDDAGAANADDTLDGGARP